MERPFDEDLTSLKKLLLEMAGLVEEAIADAVASLKERREDKARAVLEREKAVNLYDIEVDALAMRLLALHQPVAVDLRFITSAMRICGDLERMGDQAVNIAERSLDLIRQPLLKPLIDIPEMARLAEGMVKDAIDAFVRGDAALAQRVCERDDAVDEPERPGLPRAPDLHDGRSGNDPPGHGPDPRRPEPRTDRRPRHEHRRARHLHQGRTDRSSTAARGGSGAIPPARPS